MAREERFVHFQNRNFTVARSSGDIGFFLFFTLRKTYKTGFPDTHNNINVYLDNTVGTSIYTQYTTGRKIFAPRLPHVYIVYMYVSYPKETEKMIYKKKAYATERRGRGKKDQ